MVVRATGETRGSRIVQTLTVFSVGSDVTVKTSSEKEIEVAKGTGGKHAFPSLCGLQAVCTVQLTTSIPTKPIKHGRTLQGVQRAESGSLGLVPTLGNRLG